jgi:hypothetical protein
MSEKSIERTALDLMPWIEVLRDNEGRVVGYREGTTTAHLTRDMDGKTTSIRYDHNGVIFIMDLEAIGTEANLSP